MTFPPDFEQAVALEASALVLQAYRQYDAFRKGLNWSLKGNYAEPLAIISATPTGLLSGSEPFGFVAKNLRTDKLFVVFRGTESLEDWLSDLSLTQTPHPWGNVEKGFFNLYAQCADAVRDAVGSTEAAEVVVTGHSLGAALAVLAAADLAGFADGPALEMYNFAGPRTGDSGFAAKFNQALEGRAWRIVNTEDIVPTLPLATSLLKSGQVPHTPLALLLQTLKKFNYTHVGQVVNFTVNKGSIVDNHSMELYNAGLS